MFKIRSGAKLRRVPYYLLGDQGAHPENIDNLGVPHQLAVTSLPRVRRSVENLMKAQAATGGWEGEVVWNTMLLSQFVLLRRIVGQWPLASAERSGAIRHFERTQLLDGSWGMHRESLGYLFHTTLAYIAMRVLGVPSDDRRVARARDWILSNPAGPLALPSWGKFWLAILGLYEYSCINPVPPELFLLPAWAPLSPDRLYCHTRYALLPMAYIYSRRFRGDLGMDGVKLRRELYPSGYENTRFEDHRNDVARSDLLVALPAIVRRVNDVQAWFESQHLHPLRSRAAALCLDRIAYEQRATGYQGLSPVNAILNCLALYAANPRHPELERSVAGLEAWLWNDAEDGLRVAGARSTVWDSAFAMRALLEFGDRRTTEGAILAGAHFLRDAQVTEEIDNAVSEARDPVLGGWCFTAGAHRWPVSDCTAEVLSTLLEVQAARGIATIGPDWARRAVDFIMARQNADGGFGSYESRRAGDWLEALNPSEMYADCMTEKSYTECTASCIGTLARYRTMTPDEGDRVDEAIDRGIRLLRARQLRDGAFSGSWGINFTYATFHVVEAFSVAGLAGDYVVDRALAWLVAIQKADGGWGEHWRGCLTGEYLEHPQSQATMTAWALLALLNAPKPTWESIERRVSWLLNMQQSDGTWPRQSPAGVFFRTAALDYSLYRFYFPLWALARFERRSKHGRLC